MSSKVFEGKPANAPISQRYGVFPQASGQPWIHVGDDYAGERGDPVWTISAGKVLYAGPGELVPDALADRLMLYRGSDASGNCVITDHPGWMETHNHLDTVTVKTGQIVSRGTQVGTMGDSGNAYGVHLHHEVLLTPASNIPPFSRFDPHLKIEHENHQATKQIIVPTQAPTTTGKGFLMALTDKQQDELYQMVKNLHDDYRQGIPGVQSDGDTFNLFRRMASKAGVRVDESARRAKWFGKRKHVGTP